MELSVRQQLDLTGKVALVTGGGRGLGRSIALGLAEFGAKVVLAGRTETALANTMQEIQQAGGQARYVITDVSKVDQIRAAVDFAVSQFGRLDVMVNNAATTLVKPTLEHTVEDFMHVINTNLTSCFFGCQAAAIQFIRQGSGGVIINVSSIGALQGGSGVYSSYSAAKGGVVSLTRSLASEWARENIRVNCIAPGAFYTDMSKAAHDNPEIHARYLRRIPLGRIGQPYEIAPLAVYLASPASSFVTGEVFVIDGGQVMR